MTMKESFGKLLLTAELSVIFAVTFLSQDVNAFCSTYSKIEVPCKDGREYVYFQTWSRQNDGTFACVKSRAFRSCFFDKQTQCRCRIYGDPHYMTFDKQKIDFMGKCRYVVSESQDKGDSCYFKVAVQNQMLPNQGGATSAKDVHVTMDGQKMWIAKKRVFYIWGNGQWIKTSYPYTSKYGIRVYDLAGTLIVHNPRCDVKVYFDGWYEVNVVIPKILYSGKVRGMCGNCNGKWDDVKQCAAKDAKTAGDVFARCLDDADSQEAACKHLPPKVLTNDCNGNTQRLIQGDKYCGAIIHKLGPFSACLKSNRLNLQALFKACFTDLCVSSKINTSKMISAYCQILHELNSECVSAGYGNIDWLASHKECRPTCGQNQHYVLKVQSCPKTCVHHFFGQNVACKAVKPGQGCECSPGYVLDGQKCVKPEDCSNCNGSKTLQKCTNNKETIAYLNRVKGKCQKTIVNRSCGLVCLPRIQLIGKCENSQQRYSTYVIENGECVKKDKVKSCKSCGAKWIKHGSCSNGKQQYYFEVLVGNFCLKRWTSKPCKSCAKWTKYGSCLNRRQRFFYEVLVRGNCKKRWTSLPCSNLCDSTWKKHGSCTKGKQLYYFYIEVNKACQKKWTSKTCTQECE